MAKQNVPFCRANECLLLSQPIQARSAFPEYIFVGFRLNVWCKTNLTFSGSPVIELYLLRPSSKQV